MTEALWPFFTKASTFNSSKGFSFSFTSVVRVGSSKIFTALDFTMGSSYVGDYVDLTEASE